MVTLSAGCGSSAESPPVFGGRGATIPEGSVADAPPPAAAAAGPCSEPAPRGETARIDDFEDEDNKIFKAFEREGWWYTATDDTEGGAVLPPSGSFAPVPLPAEEATLHNEYAAHLTASGFEVWGATWGTTLRFTREGIKCAFNGSSFAGIRFRAKGNGTLRVNLGTPETIPVEDGGRCEERCYDTHARLVRIKPDWQVFEVRWGDLQQGGWGTQARFDPARLLNVGFNADKERLPVDVWLDDIEFLVEAGAPPSNQSAVNADRAP